MAAKQPEKKDTKMLAVGVPRAVILAEFGAPVSTVKNGDETVDIFSFKQGYGKAAKFGRMMFHGVADVATLGLWDFGRSLVLQLSQDLMAIILPIKLLTIKTIMLKQLCN